VTKFINWRIYNGCNSNRKGTGQSGSAGRTYIKMMAQQQANDEDTALQQFESENLT
jgi:hypothetical protein